ncbi:MAG: hypothetical protein MUC63_01970 [Planctomycetes bacterium]|nr:hypothetical protein [Planctomycetota bacterium]
MAAGAGAEERAPAAEPPWVIALRRAPAAVACRGSGGTTTREGTKGKRIFFRPFSSFRPNPGHAAPNPAAITSRPWEGDRPDFIN